MPEKFPEMQKSDKLFTGNRQTVSSFVTSSLNKIIFPYILNKKQNHITETTNERKVLIMSVLIVNKENFDSVKNSSKPVLLDFYADWCGPCRMVSPIVEEIAEENPQYLIGKINVDREPELAQRFKVMSIPTLAVLKNGEIIRQSAGARPKAEILSMLKN